MNRDPRRGSAPMYLLATLVLSCATGVGVYLYLKDHYAHAKVAEASTPRVAPTPAPPPAPEPAAVPVEPPAPVPIVPEPAPVPTEVPAEPDELSAEQIQQTMTAARNRFVDCAPSGALVLTMRIRPSGRVEQAAVDGADSDEMRTCLVSAAKRIRFPKSTKGLTTRYSLVGE